MTKWTQQPTGSLTTLALPTEESGMNFPPEVTDQELPSLIRRFKGITGWSPWQKRLAWLEAGVKQTVAMPNFWRERFELELAFAAIHKRYNVTRRYPRRNLTIDHQRFFSFVSMLVRCYERLNQRGQNRLRGMILDFSQDRLRSRSVGV